MPLTVAAAHDERLLLMQVNGF